MTSRSVHRPVLGIDASTKTGLCTDGELSLVKFGSVSKGDRIGEIDRLQRVWEWAGSLPATSVVFIEGYSHASKYFAHQAGEIGGTMRLRFAIRQISFVEIAPSAVKKYATGNGGCGKPDMRMAAYKRLDIDEPSDDKVDALWLWAMGMDWLGKPVVKMPAKNREAIADLHIYGRDDRLVVTNPAT